MKKTLKNSLKISFTAASFALISACGGGGDTIVVVDQPHAFLSVDNLNIGNGVVCIEDIFLDAGSPQGQQAARDLANFYGVANLFASPLNLAYSAPTFCGGPTSNFVPAPGLIIDANYYYNVIVPRVR
jgi:hypothetical protein